MSKNEQKSPDRQPLQNYLRTSQNWMFFRQGVYTTIFYEDGRDAKVMHLFVHKNIHSLSLKYISYYLNNNTFIGWV